MQICGNAADADDVCQKVFIAVWRGLKSLRDPEAFTSWVMKITANLSKHQMKEWGQTISLDEDDSYDIDIPDEDADVLPERFLLEKDFSEHLFAIINKLPEARKQTVLLYYYSGLDYKEIAEVFGVSIATVGTNLLRAKKMIREELEKEYGKDGAFGLGEAI